MAATTRRIEDGTRLAAPKRLNGIFRQGRIGTLIRAVDMCRAPPRLDEEDDDGAVDYADRGDRWVHVVTRSSVGEGGSDDLHVSSLYAVGSVRQRSALTEARSHKTRRPSESRSLPRMIGPSSQPGSIHWPQVSRAPTPAMSSLHRPAKSVRQRTEGAGGNTFLGYRVAWQHVTW